MGLCPYLWIDILRSWYIIQTFFSNLEPTSMQVMPSILALILPSYRMLSLAMDFGLTALYETASPGSLLMV